MPGTPDEKFRALRTVRVRTFAVDVSFVDVTQSRVERNFSRVVKSLRWRARFVLKLEVRMKRREV
jgi:hypothetical protein